ncbi:DUF7448 domain-containing protein [Mycolicibacterium septicum]|uniref:DUF7448 domain-containing protein n=1 Tax=Mycolicibacterium septicum TaxID=98668 RepID=UPI001AF5E52F|nr:hypothetical protein [Mycolicibacterium septicum]QRY51828.1 hypothetical protein JVX95_31390 [Mycolicibacterium septicum]
MSEENVFDVAPIRELIVGKRVASVVDNGAKLVLEDGTALHLYMSASDCCASAYGDWVIQPDSLEAIITDVKFDLLADREYDGDGATSRATITILHNQNPVALADCYANDGNGGYYFSVLSLKVEVPNGADVDLDVISA